MARDPLRGQARQFTFGVPGVDGPLERGGRQVGGDDRTLDTYFFQEHRDAVGLLAVRAARAPDTHRLVQAAQDVIRQQSEMLGMPEERGLLDGDAIDQALQGIPATGQIADVGVDVELCTGGVFADASLQAATQGGFRSKPDLAVQ